MPLRLGTDLCDPSRIEKVLRRYGKKFLNKILTTEEQEYLDFGFNQRSFKPTLSHRLAARYAAKEAVAKALGTGIGKDVAFHDILILKKENCGAPYIKLDNKAVDIAEELGINKWEISISHEKAMSVAIVIGYKE